VSLVLHYDEKRYLALSIIFQEQHEPQIPGQGQQFDPAPTGADVASGAAVAVTGGNPVGSPHIVQVKEAMSRLIPIFQVWYWTPQADNLDLIQRYFHPYLGYFRMMTCTIKMSWMG
jgi:hypothetical protein